MSSTLPGSFFERSPDPIAVFEFVDGEPVIRAVNPAFEATFAVGGDGVAGERLGEVAPPIAGERGYARVLDPAAAAEAELRCRTTEGVEVFLVRSSEPEDGKGYVVFTEVSEHKRVEERFSALVNSSSDVLTILDREGRFTYVSPAVETVLGATADELEGERAIEWVHPDDRETVTEEFFADPTEWTGETRTATYRFRDPEGGWRVVEAVAKSRLDDPAVDGVIVNSRDVTERERRKEELETFETVVETVPVGVLVLDEEARIEFINPRGAEMVGMDPGELVGTHFLELVGEGFVDPGVVETYREKVREMVSSKTDVEREAAEIRVTPVGSDGHRVLEAHFGLLPFEEEYRGTVNVFRDITERKRYEEKLEEKNARLEQFASFVSHDLRNPMNVARGYAERAVETGDTGAVEEVLTSLDRMEQLTEELLTMARQGREVEAVRPLDLADTVRRAWRTVETGAATLDVRTDPDRIVRADESLLRQLLENLFRNAVEHGSTSPPPGAEDAVEHGSTDPPPPAEGAAEGGEGSTAEGGEGSTAEGPGDAGGDPAAGAGVRVTVGDLPDGFYVADDGPGIPPEDRERVFEVGYTTSEDGTGFGLAIVDQVAEAHGWSVTATESADGGARFEVTGVDPG